MCRAISEGAMQIVDHTGQEREQWRPAVMIFLPLTGAPDSVQEYVPVDGHGRS